MKTCVTVTSFEEGLKIATGEANRERSHVVVPLYMPLSAAIPHDAAVKYVNPLIREWIGKGKCQLVAVAGGTMNESGEAPRQLQLVLLYGTLHEEDGPDYMTFDTLEGEVDMAVMMNGDGTRYWGKGQLPAKEALIKWMAGFLNWNCEHPGLYEFSYALVESQGKGEMV